MKNGGTMMTKMLMVVAILLAADIASRIAAPVAMAALPTGGGIPDSGAQLEAVIDQVKITNSKLDTLQALLESGKLTVQTKSMDEKK